MPVRDNPTLGHTLCSECNEQATVHQQTRGAGRYLYTRGCDCKYRNSTGAKFQSRLWHETEWLDGANAIKPPNVTTPTQHEETPTATDSTSPATAATSTASLAPVMVALCVALVGFILKLLADKKASNKRTTTDRSNFNTWN